MADAAVETAPADENDDSWLYGESVTEHADAEAAATEDKAEQQDKESDGLTRTETEGKEQEEAEGNEANNDDSHFNDEHFAEVARDQDQTNGDADSQDNGDSDSDDSDDVKVTIGEIKSGPQAYASLNIKRGVGIVAPGSEKPRPVPTTGSKVTLEDLDGPGSINGVPALEFNIDTIEDKPWNKPGADISDYFNYGFNEVTWSAYCERQRRMRVNEAGVSMHAPPPRAPPPDTRRTSGSSRHDDLPPPGMQNNYQSRENTIQVMTAERREYGRTHGRDAPPADYFSAPPPDHYYPPHPTHPPHPSHPPHAPYEDSWAHPEQTGWAPTEIKELTPGPMGPPPMAPPMGMNPPIGAPHSMPPSHVMGTPPFAPPFRSHMPPHMHERDRDRDRDRDRLRERDERERRDRDRRDDEERGRDRERSRSIKPDRIREKSYRRERSRSRSRRHKSRSRSPRPRERSRDRSRDRERSTKSKNKEKEKDEEK